MIVQLQGHPPLSRFISSGKDIPIFSLDVSCDAHRARKQARRAR